MSASSVPEEAGEEGETGEPVAGPSSPRGVLTSSPISSPTEQEPVQTATGQRLNPKASSSWMKWNSPAPTFPRSISREKGKGKERERIDVVDDEARDDTRPMRSQSDEAVNTDSAGSSGAPPPETNDNAQPEAPTAPTFKDESGTSTTVPAPNRGRWWSRAAPVAQSPATAEAPKPPESNADQPILTSAPKPIAEAPVPPAITAESKKEGSTTHSTAQAGTSPDSIVTSLRTAPEHPETSDVVASDTAHAVSEPRQEQVAQNSSGWLGYLGRGRQQSARSGTPAITAGKTAANTELPANKGLEEESPNPVDANEAHDVAASPEQVTTQPEAAAPQVSGPPKAGWGSYLYSFVASPAAPTSQDVAPTLDPDPTETTVEVDPTSEQRPVPTTPPAVSVQAATPQSVTTAPHPHVPAAVSSLASTPTPADGSPAQARKGSTSSQSGWLNYLAFRASQKKIPNASTASIKSGKEKERKSLDGPEEIMDFSNDPNFPASSGVSVAPNAAEGEGVRDKAAAQSAPVHDVPTSKKSTQALAVAKGRRLSNGSTKSGNLTPLSSSPKTKVSPRTPNASTLPGPAAPVPPAAQPSFVIPTFESTFDKPPRSLPPLPENTGGTSALAWKAIGAVGSYVYGAGDDVKEGKGMREGRRVGSGLPRKVGLGEAKGGLGPDDGWKHVKRVVVVGVHGWFPAKMLNSYVNHLGSMAAVELTASVIGEPTGTSIKFANMMGASVKRFFDERGVHDIRLTLMPLEGEGTIESRVDRCVLQKMMGFHRVFSSQQPVQGLSSQPSVDQRSPAGRCRLLRRALPRLYRHHPSRLPSHRARPYPDALQ